MKLSHMTLFFTSLFVQPRAKEAVKSPRSHVCDLGWVGNHTKFLQNTKAIEDCDIFENYLNVDLDKLVSKKECVSRVNVKIGPHGTLSQGASKSSHHSILNIALSNTLADQCSMNKVTVNLVDQNVNTFTATSWLDPVACLTNSKVLVFEETDKASQIKIKILDNEKILDCLSSIKIYNSSKTEIAHGMYREDVNSRRAVFAWVIVDRCKHQTLTVILTFRTGSEQTIAMNVDVPMTKNITVCPVGGTKNKNNNKELSVTLIAAYSAGGGGGIIILLIITIVVCKFKGKRAKIEENIMMEQNKDINPIYGLYHR